MAQQGAPLLLLSILKQGDITEPVTVAAVCGAAKKLAANEEICKELADDGAVQVTMEVRLVLLLSALSTTFTSVYLTPDSVTSAGC